MKSILLTLTACFVLTLPALAQKFDSTWTKVPKLFFDDDIQQVVRAIEKSPIVVPKDEFETTAAWTSRTTNLKALNLGNGKTGESLLVFRDKPETFYSRPIFGLSASYDADTQMLSMSLALRRVRSESGGYLASGSINLLGMLEIAAGNGVQQYYIAIDNTAGHIRELPTLSRQIRLPAAEARKAKDALAFLVTGRIVSPYTEDVITAKILVLDVSEIWIFNEDNGAVYAKFNSDDLIYKPRRKPL